MGGATFANSIVYINDPMFQQILAEPQWMTRMTPDDLRAITPLIFTNVTPYGAFDLDLTKRLNITVPPITLN
jgi:hypothetical protein